MSLDFDAWSREVGRLKVAMPKSAASKYVRWVALRALDHVVKGSPVGNPDLWQSPAPPGYVGGQFRGNWFVDVGQIAARVADGVDPDGGKSVSRGSAVISTIAENPYQVIWIHNSLPYAAALENGHSTQAPGPAAIVGKAVVTLRREIPGLR